LLSAVVCSYNNLNIFAMNWIFWKKKTAKLDCRGLSCPQPVIKTRDTLDQGNRIVEVTVDNEAAKNNIIRFVEDQNCTVQVTEPENGCWILLVRAGRVCRRQQNAATNYSCASVADDELVYVISSASMGQGNDQLGWALLQTYIQTIEEVKPLPTKILFYNGGGAASG
jgi:selenium metabolism protein YedF